MVAQRVKERHGGGRGDDLWEIGWLLAPAEIEASI